MANNWQGIANAASGVRILPVRVLSKGGRFDSDMLADMCMYWAVGIDQDATPGSSTPARMLNMSLGGARECGFFYLQAVYALTERNAVVVAAARNTTGRTTGSPANCPGVIGVAGLRDAGSKVCFSDLGPEITISAPGGNCVNIDERDAWRMRNSNTLFLFHDRPGTAPDFA